MVDFVQLTKTTRAGDVTALCGAAFGADDFRCAGGESAAGDEWGGCGFDAVTRRWWAAEQPTLQSVFSQFFLEKRRAAFIDTRAEDRVGQLVGAWQDQQVVRLA